VAWAWAYLPHQVRRSDGSVTDVTGAYLGYQVHPAREAGATHMTVACLGAPGHPQARGLYYGVGFRQFTRDAPLIKHA